MGLAREGLVDLLSSDAHSSHAGRPVCDWRRGSRTWPRFAARRRSHGRPISRHGRSCAGIRLLHVRDRLQDDAVGQSFDHIARSAAQPVAQEVGCARRGTDHRSSLEAIALRPGRQPVRPSSRLHTPRGSLASGRAVSVAMLAHRRAPAPAARRGSQSPPALRLASSPRGGAHPCQL